MKTVLVVDDDPGITTMVTTALEDEGYRVVTAASSDAAQVAREQHPDAILLDLMMPDVDGVEVSRQLRADRRTTDIPIIAMSTAGNIHAAVGRMLVNARLCKPFELTDLYCTLAQWAE